MADVLDFSTDKSAMTRIRLIATFYKSSYAFVSWVISFICLALIYMQGIAIITPLFWFKLLMDISVILTHQIGHIDPPRVLVSKNAIV